MFYKVVFWCIVAMCGLAAVAFGYIYLMACMMGMPSCIL